MSDALRRFRRHPIYSTLGTVFATALIGLTSLMWFGAMARMAMGQPFPHNGIVALIVVSALGGWYLNFMTVYHRLRRIDPEVYALATKDMGFIAFFGSTRSAPTHLHNALAGLDLDRCPASFRWQVRFTLLVNAMLLWSCCAVVVGLLVMSLLRNALGVRGHG
jgi:hypothetical protein